jgi:hypothetical protein
VLALRCSVSSTSALCLFGCGVTGICLYCCSKVHMRCMYHSRGCVIGYFGLLWRLELGLVTWLRGVRQAAVISLFASARVTLDPAFDTQQLWLALVKKTEWPAAPQLVCDPSPVSCVWPVAARCWLLRPAHCSLMCRLWCVAPCRTVCTHLAVCVWPRAPDHGQAQQQVLWLLLVAFCVVQCAAYQCCVAAHDKLRITTESADDCVHGGASISAAPR